MKSIWLLVLFLGYSSSAFSQARLHDVYDSRNLELGYSYSFGDVFDKNFHLINVGLNKMRYGGLHGAGYQYGVATDIGLNTRDFVFGPKISGFVYFQFLVIGSELVTYTDFDAWTLRYVPVLGIGGEFGRLTINPHVILANTRFKPINEGLINFSINLKLNKKKFVWD